MQGLIGIFLLSIPNTFQRETEITDGIWPQIRPLIYSLKHDLEFTIQGIRLAGYLPNKLAKPNNLALYPRFIVKQGKLSQTTWKLTTPSNNTIVNYIALNAMVTFHSSITSLITFIFLLFQPNNNLYWEVRFPRQRF